MAAESKTKSKTTGLGVGIGEYKLPLSLFQNNRQKVFERMKNALTKTKADGNANAVALFQGGEEQFRYDTDHELLFRQESNFLYMFGVNEPGCYGALDLSTGDSILFIPRHGLDYEIWCGPASTPMKYQEIYGVDLVFYVDEITSIFKERQVQVVHVAHGKNTDSGRYSLPTQFDGMDQFTIDRNHLHREICECRVIKTEEEIDVLRYIVSLSSLAHIEVMQKCRPGMREYELEAIFRHYTQVKGGSRYLAYTCICGSGPNGAVLHYGHAAAPNDRKFGDNEMMLLDMGAEYHGYCADITCSFPSTGRFSPDQRAVYEAVLAAQRAVEAAMKPGVLWSDMHRLAERTILEHLIQMNLVIPKDKTIEQLHRELLIPAFFMPHGLGHFLGLDTHDVGGYPEGVERINEFGIRSLRTNRVLQANMVLTVEPGCYFIEPLLNRALADPKVAPYLNAEKLKTFLRFGGVRLEDDVVVRENGIENLTRVPRTVEEVERCMAQGRDANDDQQQQHQHQHQQQHHHHHHEHGKCDHNDHHHHHHHHHHDHSE